VQKDEHNAIAAEPAQIATNSTAGINSDSGASTIENNIAGENTKSSGIQYNQWHCMSILYFLV